MEVYGSLDLVLGHYRRYAAWELKEKMEAAGFNVKRILEFNRVSRPGWHITGRLLKRKAVSRLRMRVFDRTVRLLAAAGSLLGLETPFPDCDWRKRAVLR